MRVFVGLRVTLLSLYACVRKPSRDTMLDVCKRVVLGDGVVVSGDSYILWIHFGIYIPIPYHRVCKWSVLSLAFENRHCFSAESVGRFLSAYF